MFTHIKLSLCKPQTWLYNTLTQRTPMKAVATNGSPRKGGNTEILLRKVLEPLTDGTETMQSFIKQHVNDIGAWNEMYEEGLVKVPSESRGKCH
jgi:hypothetical protein